jgi:hypothetical protein
MTYSEASAVELNDMSKKKRGRPSLPSAVPSTTTENTSASELIRKDTSKRFSRHSNPSDEMELEGVEGAPERLVHRDSNLFPDDQSGHLEEEQMMCFDTSSADMDESSTKELPKKAKKGYIYLDREKGGKGEKSDKEDSLVEARARTLFASSVKMSNIEDRSSSSECVQASKGRGRPSKNRDEDYISPYLQAKAAREELQKEKQAENDERTAVITNRGSRPSRTIDEEDGKASSDNVSNDDSPHMKISSMAGDNELKDGSIEGISEVIGNEDSGGKEMAVEAAREEGKKEEYEGRRLHDEEEKGEVEEIEEVLY